MKLAHIQLTKPMKGIPPDAKRSRDEVDATESVTFDFNASMGVVEVREAGALVLLIPKEICVMTPRKP